jgi:hypothetical protein
MLTVQDVPRLVLPVAYAAVEFAPCGPVRVAAFPAVPTDTRAWGLCERWSAAQRRTTWRLLTEVRASCHTQAAVP